MNFETILLLLPYVIHEAIGIRQEPNTEECPSTKEVVIKNVVIENAKVLEVMKLSFTTVFHTKCCDPEVQLVMKNASPIPCFKGAGSCKHRPCRNSTKIESDILHSWGGCCPATEREFHSDLSIPIPRQANPILKKGNDIDITFKVVCGKVVTECKSFTVNVEGIQKQ